MEYTYGYRDNIIIPDKHNTGYSGELTSMADFFGSYYKEGSTMYITASLQNALGTVYENIDFTNVVNLNKTNLKPMTFRNCRFNNTAPYAVNTGSNFLTNDIEVVFENCEFSGQTSACVQPTAKFKMINCKIHDMGSDGGKVFDNGLYENCYFYNIGMTDGAHADGIQITGTNNNFSIINCRFDVPSYTGYSSNSGIFFVLEGDSYNSVIKDCVMTGGNYTFYYGRKDVESGVAIEGNVVNNIIIGCSYRYGILNDNSNSFNHNEVKAADKLFVSSVYKENGKIKLLVTNYTNTERVLKLVTDSGITSVTIPACPLCTDGLAYTTLSDFPFDIEIEVNGNYIVCYDTEISEEHQIRYVTFVEDNSITVSELFKQICDAIREKTGTTNLIKHTDIPSMIRSIIINCNEHLSSITATKTKTEYTVNDTLNIDDITVTANYSDGSSSVVSGWTSNVSDIDMASEGTKTLTISYTENEITKTTSVDITVSAVTPEPEPSPIVPQTGTWQLKETTGKKYIILGTDDDNNGNAKYFRLLRTYGFPYTMNTEAETVSQTKALGTDVDDTIFTDADAPALFPDGVDVITLGKYLHDNNLGEVAQHGHSGSVLWDSEKLTGDFLTSLHTSYVEQGGTKTEEELRIAIMEQLADTDVAQDAPYVARARRTLEEIYGFHINTVGIWGGSVTAVIDNIELNLTTIKNATNYNWRKHNYSAVSSILGSVGENNTLYDIRRLTNNDPDINIKNISSVKYGKALELFWHNPFGDIGIDGLRTIFNHIKSLVDSGDVEVVTRMQYAKLGEYVDNPVIKIEASRDYILIGNEDSKTAYTVIATYEDGSTSDVTIDSFIDNRNVNVSVAGNYNVAIEYKGINTNISVVVSDGTVFPVDLGLCYMVHTNDSTGAYEVNAYYNTEFGSNHLINYNTAYDYYITYNNNSTNNNTYPTINKVYCYAADESYLGYIGISNATGKVSDVVLPRVDETYPDTSFIRLQGRLNKSYPNTQVEWSCYYKLRD